MIRRVALFAMVTIVFAQFGPLTSGYLVQAEDTAINRTGVINVGSANIRSDPNVTDTNIITTLNLSNAVTVNFQTTGGPTSSYGDQWYNISFTKSDTPMTGYIVAAFVTLDPLPTPTPVSYTASADFEAYLTAEGFPESYKVGLRELHALYPNWVFKAKQTGLDWATVLANESSAGRSLISTSYDGYKSLEPAAYDWATNTWRVWDGSTWVMCNTAVLSYYMDPRNFINPTLSSFESGRRMFQFEALNYQPDVHSLAGVERILSTCFMSSTPNANMPKDANGNYIVGFDYLDPATNTTVHMSYAETFIKAAQEANVSPLHLAARSLIELGGDGSSSSNGTFSADLIATYAHLTPSVIYTPTTADTDLDGLYNFYNVNAYSGTGPLENIRHGLEYAKDGSGKPVTIQTAADIIQLIPWNNRYSAIVGGAEWIAASYISIGQNTLYLQKFDVDNSDGKLYYHQYMTNVKAAWSESSSLYNAYSNIGVLNDAITFNIPVFLNMPETTCALPTTGNPNNWLSTLTVDALSLTPSFDPATTGEYGLIVENGVTSVNIGATAVAATSAIAGTGSKTLAVGSNPFSIVVTAQNGTTRTYTLNIVRKAPPEIPPLTSTAYTISGAQITGLDPTGGLNTVAAITGNLTVAEGYGYSVVVLNPNGTVNTTSLVGTGSTVRVMVGGQSVQDYKVVLYGDANGDGRINAIDLTAVRWHMLLKKTINGSSIIAADVNRDGKINAIDLAYIKRYMFNLLTIKQT